MAPPRGRQTDHGKELQKRIVPELKKKGVPQAVLDELERNDSEQFPSLNIVFMFDNFYYWLDTTPLRGPGDHLTDGRFPNVDVAISTFRVERDRFITSSVTDRLNEIKNVASGLALFGEIKRAAESHFIFIRPDVAFRSTGDPFPHAGVADQNDLTSVKKTSAVGMPILVHGTWKPDSVVKDGKRNFLGSGEGTRIDPRTGKTIHGDDVFIDYSPEAFVLGKPSRGVGPTRDPDHVLFHELVHATRHLRGVVYNMPVDQGYNNEEEYLAIMLTNIYARNKNKGALLRASAENPGVWLIDPDRFLDNVQRVNLEPRVLLERFRQKQGAFFDDLAGIDLSVANFNPVKQYALELWVRKLGRTLLKR
jgi:hypothetical protein